MVLTRLRLYLSTVVLKYSITEEQSLIVYVCANPKTKVSNEKFLKIEKNIFKDAI